MELLKKWVFDDGLPVTVAYVTRHNDLNASEASTLLQEFADQHKGKRADISVTYLLSGDVPSLSTTNKSAQRTKVTVCKDEELEKRKSEFTSLASCSVYSVQAAPLKSLHSIFDVDWMDEELFPKKPLVQNKQAVEYLEQWKQGHPVGAAMTKAPAQKKAPVKPLAVKSTLPQRSQGNTISAMFAGTAKKEKHETPTKSKRKAEATPEKKSGGPSSAKQRRGGVYLSSSDEDEPDAKPSPVKKGRSPKAQSKDFLDEHDDIFCTGEDDSFEEPMEVEPLEKTPQKKQKASKLSPVATTTSANTKTVKNEEDVEEATTSSPPEPQTRRAYRKEKVTENFVDEDGYLVTREVPKVVEVDEIAIPKKSQSKPVLTAANKAKTDKKQPPKGQSKISSYFTKKQ
ncbi:Protein R04F11.3 [Aphelenchoides avenae]|nr:Protein R04F11.3 [Aphelenchus avenae]